MPALLAQAAPAHCLSLTLVQNNIASHLGLASKYMAGQYCLSF